MDEFWPAFFAGLAVLAVAGVAAWAWKPTRVLIQRWWARRMHAADQAEELAEDEQLATLREQIIERAKQLGKTIPVERSGNRVTWSDGHLSTHIPDHSTYRYKMQARQVDPFTTFNNKAPTPLSWRDRAWMETWLDDHPLP